MAFFGKQQLFFGTYFSITMAMVAFLFWKFRRGPMSRFEREFIIAFSVVFLGGLTLCDLMTFSMLMNH